MNEKSNKLIPFNTMMLVPKTDTLINDMVKICIWILLILLGIGYVMFQELLLDLSKPYTWIVIIGIIWLRIKNGGYIKKTCYAELAFYDEYMTFYVPKTYISRKYDRKEFFKIYYTNVTKCTYENSIQKIRIIGKLDITYTKYDRTGKLNEEPYYQRIVDGGMIYFYGIFEPDIDFIREIEENTPLKVKQL